MGQRGRRDYTKRYVPADKEPWMAAVNPPDRRDRTIRTLVISFIGALVVSVIVAVTPFVHNPGVVAGLTAAATTVGTFVGSTIKPAS